MAVNEEGIAPLPPGRSVPNLSPDVQHAAFEAFGNLVEKVLGGADLKKSESAPHEEPKSWFVDPFTVLDSFGMGFRYTPSALTQESLRMASERDPITAAIIGTRVGQCTPFSRPQPNKYSVGLKVRLRGEERPERMTESQKEKCLYIQNYLLQTGMDNNVDRDSFTTYIQKSVRDTLTYDAWAFEKVKTFGGEPFAFHCVDGASIRLADVRGSGRPLEEEELRRKVRYVQVMDGRRWRDFTSEEMAYVIRNPRSSTKVYRYGFPEIEVLTTTITSLLFATDYNRRLFSQGSTIKGILNLQGKIPPQQLDMLRKQWMAQISGVQNAWKTPVTNADNIQFIPLQLNNREMEFQAWLEFNIKVSCAVFQIDPAEINFDLRGSSTQQPLFMSSNEAQQKVSKDKGLRPLLHTLEDGLNRHVVWNIDPRFEVAFVGLDAKTEEQAVQLRMQQSQTFLTLNEVRALEGLKPVEHGDVVMNPVYTAVLQMKAQEAMMQGAPGGGGGPGQGDQPAPTEEDQALLSQAGEEERQGAGRLLEFLNGSSTESSSGGASNEKVLHRDDWVSSIHSSAKSPDLKKSKKVEYETIFDSDW